MNPRTTNRYRTAARRAAVIVLRPALALMIGALGVVGGGCGSPEYFRNVAMETPDGPWPRGDATVGSGGAGGASGGASASGGAPASGGAGTASGGSPSGGAPATGGRAATGGSSTGGAGTGGAATGGGAGSMTTGTGGAATGGRGTGGAGTGGAATGGAATGGRGTGGAGTGGAAIDSARYNFETNTQGWATVGTTMFSSITRDTSRHHAGGASLAGAIAASGAASYQVRVIPSPTVPAGATVTAHVYIPSGAPVDWVQLYLQEGAPNYAWTGTAATFAAGAWTMLTVTAPASGGAIAELGVQFHLTGAWTGTLSVDSVNW